MVYSTSKCPNCGKVIKRQTNPVKEIGYPFEQCRYCRSMYINSYKEEWITKSPISRFFFFLQIYVWARALIMPLLVFGVFLYFDIELNIIIWPILSVVWLIAGYFVHKNANRKDIEQSLSRTNNPEYIDRLKKAGYTIYPIKDSESKSNIKNSDHSLKADNAVVRKSDIQRSASAASKPQQKEKVLEKQSFSIEDVAGGMAEICIRELVEIMGICSKKNVSYNEKKLVVATFAYFYPIWVYNFESITVGQSIKLKEVYKEKFSLFNRKQYENEPFKIVIENEDLLAEQLVRAEQRVRNAYHADSNTFVDNGISDEFILEFVDNQEAKDKIKFEISVKILKDWASKASLTGKKVVVENN